MTTTIQTNIAQRINELYEHAQSQAFTAQAHANKAIQAAYECGKLLNEQKKLVDDGDWLLWIESNCPNITARTAQKYMKLANTNHGSQGLLDSQSLRQAYIAAGILPEPEKPLSTSTSAIVPLQTKLENKVRSLIGEIEPELKTAKPNDVEQYKGILKPLVELYERLG